MKIDNALSYVIDLRGYKQEALAGKLKIKPENRGKYSKLVSSNKKGRNKSVITNYCNRKRKLTIEDYIEILEEELKIPRGYWLDTNERNAKGEKNRNKGYVKKLSFEVKKEIDEYFKNKLDKMDSEAFRMIRCNIFEKDLIGSEKRVKYDVLIRQIDECIYRMDEECRGELNYILDTADINEKIKSCFWNKDLIRSEKSIRYDILIHTILECIYEMDDECREEYMYLQRVNILLDIMAEVKRIGVDNIRKCIDMMKKYPTPSVKVMTREEIEEYESLFGKIEPENTSE